MESSSHQCPECILRDKKIAELEQKLEAAYLEIAALNKKFDELNRRLPPLPPRPEERYPKAPAKKSKKRKRGAQKGHPPHLKVLAPPERVKNVFHFIPKECRHCHEPLPQEASANDPAPTRFQVAELPEMIAEITEYQGHGRLCSCCGKVTREPIPEELCRTSVGPNYTATLAYLAGTHGVSKRGLEEICESLFDAPLSLGSISNLEAEVATALAEPYEEVLQTVRNADVKHLDETGWKESGRKRWLWAAATSSVVIFMIHRLRNSAPLVRLLGNELVGILCTDRWHAYNIYDLDKRQLCWSHIKRNFAKLAEGGKFAKEIGEAALKVQKRVFELWYSFRGGGISRKILIAKIDVLEREMVRILSRGANGPDKKVGRFCKRLFDVQESLWTFAYVEGVEPTNNHVERVQRRAVLWRRRSFGCQSKRGCEFVERILTVVETLKLRKRSVLKYLSETIRAKRQGLKASSLVNQMA